MSFIGMVRKRLQPDQIVIPGGYELEDESKLNIYFEIFNKGDWKNLPPVIVVLENLEAYKEMLLTHLRRLEPKQYVVFSWDNLSQYTAVGASEKVLSLYEKSRKRIPRGTYYLIEDIYGEPYKSIASALTHNPIPVIELRTERDFSKMKTYLEGRRLSNFERSEDSLEKLLCSLNISCLSNLTDTKTVKEFVDELVSGEKIPKNMIDRYIQK